MYYDDNSLKKLKRKRTFFKLIIDRLFFPLIAVCPNKFIKTLGLTPIDDERLAITLQHVKGYLLDIGCGENMLVKAHGNGVGVDVFPWSGVDTVLEDTSKLPFNDCSFDTVTMLASLNHIPNRNDVLKEVRRVLKKDGKIIISMISPFVSRIVHFLRYSYDPDQHERGMKDGEVFGFNKREMIKLLENNNYKVILIKGFVFGLNRLYIAKLAC